MPCDDEDKLLFAACTTMVLGDGKKTSFWDSGWIQGRRPKDIAPSLFQASRKKKRSVHDALSNNTWIRDLSFNGRLTNELLDAFVERWSLVQAVHLQPQQEDTIIWKLTKTGTYSAASAYKVQFLGCAVTPSFSSIWKSWAPPKCKFFAWLITQNRIWSADRLAQRGWPHNDSCVLCRTTIETAHHLVAGCKYSRRIWDLVAAWTTLPDLRPNAWPLSEDVEQWWTQFTTQPDHPRKALRSLALLVIWEIWKERNARVFVRRESSTATLMAKITDEASAWIAARAKDLALILSRE
jgi:hypothetical protein